MAALVTPVTRNHRRLATQGCSRCRPRRSQTCLARSERRSLMSGTAMEHAHGITVLSGCAVSRNGRRDDCNNGSRDGFSRGKSNLALVDNSRPCCETIASLPIALGSHAYAHSIQTYASRPASSFAPMCSSRRQRQAVQLPQCNARRLTICREIQRMSLPSVHPKALRPLCNCIRLMTFTSATRALAPSFSIASQLPWRRF